MTSIALDDLQRGLLTDRHLAYAAGVVDSDGNVGIKRNRGSDGGLDGYQPTISVGQVTPQAIDAFKCWFGGGIYLEKRAAPERRDILRWQVSSRAAARVAAALEPYSLIKADQLALVVRLGELNARAIGRRHIFEPVRRSDQLVTCSEFGELVGRSAATINQAARQGSIPATKRLFQGRQRWFVRADYADAYRLRTLDNKGAPRRSAAMTAEMADLKAELHRIKGTEHRVLR